MTRPHQQSGLTKNLVVSKPIPLEFLQLGAFNLGAETRKVEGEGLRKSRFSFWKETAPVYPFVISHAAVHGKRSYTLFANSDATRKRWQEALKDAIGLREAQQQANRVSGTVLFVSGGSLTRPFRFQLFAFERIGDSLFKSLTTSVPVNSPLRNQTNAFTGKITCAARFTLRGKSYLAIDCPLGVYVGYASQPKCTSEFERPMASRSSMCSSSEGPQRV